MSRSWYVTEYRLRNMWKWKRAIIVSGLGNPFLYLASIGIGVGALVDANSRGAGIDGVPYLTFLAPALLASAAIQGAQDEVTFPVLAGFIWEKLFFAMHATSLTAKQIANGILTAALFRTLFSATAYWVVLLAFGAVEPVSALTLIPCSAFAGMAFGAFVMWVVARVKHDDSFFSIFGRFFITPMFLFSGTFYPLQSLPLSVQWIGWLSPLWHATEMGRSLSYGAGFGETAFWMHASFLGTVCGLGVLLGHRQFKRRLTA